MPYIYLVYILLTIFLGILSICTKDKSLSSGPYWFLCLFLTLMSGLSYGLGGDKQVYMQSFYDISSQASLKEVIADGFQEGYMPLWSSLQWLCKYLFNSFYAVQIIQAAIVNFSVFYFAKSFTKHIYLFALIYFVSKYFFLFNMEVMREGLAVALGLIAIIQYLNGRKLVFVLLTLLAIGFHISAAILFIVPFVRFKISHKNLFILFLCACVGCAAGDFLYERFGQMFSQDHIFMSKILMYFNITLNITGISVGFIQHLLLPGFIIYVYTKYNENTEHLPQMEKLACAFLIIGALIAAIPGFLRFRNYVEIIYLVFVCEFIADLLTHKEYRITRTVITLFVFIFFARGWAMKFDQQYYSYKLYIPYTSIFDENYNLSEREEIHEVSVTEESDDETQRTH